MSRVLPKRSLLRTSETTVCPRPREQWTRAGQLLQAGVAAPLDQTGPMTKYAAWPKTTQGAASVSRKSIRLVCVERGVPLLFFTPHHGRSGPRPCTAPFS